MRTRTRRIVAALTGLVVALALGYLAYRLVVEDAERQQLVGSWAGDGMTLVVERHQLTLTQPGGDGSPRVTRMLFRLEPGATPKRILMIDADNPANAGPQGPRAGGTVSECPGIYEVDGDRLRMCVGLPGGSFPAGFDPAEGLVVTLHRVP